MATKREEINVGGCLHAAAEDEPLFVLRAQDRMAPALVRLWAAMLDVMNSHDNETEATYKSMVAVQLAKSEEARGLAERMEAWQMVHGSKVPD